jgi:tetratricopeptide (TPR) repeat protein
MKKTKRSPEPKRETRSVIETKPAAKWWLRWWVWVTVLAGLLVVFEAYGPALNGGFVLDDRFLPYYAPVISNQISGWVGTNRPLLMLSFWLDHLRSGSGEPVLSVFHSTNILIHFLTSVFVALIAAKLLEWAGVAARMRTVLAIFAGALFLLHPVQTESVAYVASRSENLSILFFFAAYAIFLYRQGESITLLRAVAVLALFGAAAATKQHTLVLPALLLLTDYFWGRGGILKNRILYGLLAIGGAIGGVALLQILRTTTSAGFRVEGFTPFSYFFTQCRVIWIYIRLFFLPYGQNIDPDIPVSHTLFEHGAIFGLLGLIALVAAAWMFRRRYPLGSFGIFMFLLLLAPTSSFVPILDVLAEHRLYLPFPGLALVCLEIMRRMKLAQAASLGVAVLAACTFLTYQRSEVWESPLSLWEDSVSKSPNKYRPRFQVAFAKFDIGHCVESLPDYEKAAQVGPVDDQLLIDWALALDCAGNWPAAVDKLKQAALFHNTAHLHSQIGMVNAKHGQTQEALQALAEAEKIDPKYDMTYVYRGNIYEQAGDRAAAAREYERAVKLNAGNQPARDGLARVSH